MSPFGTPKNTPTENQLKTSKEKEDVIEILKRSSVKETKRRAIARKYKIKSNDEIPPDVEKLKQQLLAKFRRIMCFEERRLFYSQNIML